MPACVCDLCSAVTYTPKRLFHWNGKAPIVGEKWTIVIFHLTAGNSDCRGRGEPGNDWQWEEIDEETKSKEACDEDDDAGEEGEQDGVLRPVVRDLRRHQRHDGRRANVDVFLTAIAGFIQREWSLPSKDDVSKAAHDGGVKPILRRQASNICIGNALQAQW